MIDDIAELDALTKALYLFGKTRESDIDKYNTYFSVPIRNQKAGMINNYIDQYSLYSTIMWNESHQELIVPKNNLLKSIDSDSMNEPDYLQKLIESISKEDVLIGLLLFGERKYNHIALPMTSYSNALPLLQKQVQTIFNSEIRKSRKTLKFTNIEQLFLEVARYVNIREITEFVHFLSVTDKNKITRYLETYQQQERCHCSVV